jgi:hypothetical protein
MDTIVVHRLRARYRIPGGDTGAKARLDAALREVLDGALETALARAGVSAHEEVCIRHVNAPARLRLDGGESALAAAWSAALAGAVRATLDAGGDAVVRYGTRAQALADLIVSVARTRYGRAWAWRQLGLWTAGDAPSSPSAAEEVARALIANPELALASLVAAARAGALAPLAPRISAATWAGIARAALRAAAVSASTVARLLPGAATELEVRASRAAQPMRALGSAFSVDEETSIDPIFPDKLDIATRTADRVARASALYPAAVAAADEDARLALAVLAVLEADPAVLLRASAAEAVAAVAEQAAADAAVRAASPRDAMPDAHPERRRDAGSSDAASPLDARRPTRRDADPASADHRPDEKDSGGDRHAADLRADDHLRATPAESRSDAAADGRASTENAVNAGAELGDGDEVGVAEWPDETDNAAAGMRRTGETRWGGLLFLLHVVAALGIPAEIVGSPVFAARPLRWVMHRIALALLALDESDAAALAFAGGAPGTEPPSRGEPTADELEEAAFADVAARVSAALHERLRGEPAPDARAASALLRETCRRAAVIEADPGWLDVRLSLDEVDTSIRRAGLDLDPGWIPWLGVVVRFVYA